LQPKTSRLTRNAFGQARWDDTIGYYWTRADGRALSISNTRVCQKAKRSYLGIWCVHLKEMQRGGRRWGRGWQRPPRKEERRGRGWRRCRHQWWWPRDGKLLYLSYTTDWPGVSVGHPAGALAIFCLMGSFDMVDLRFCVTFCPGDFYFLLCYTHFSF
jgi:hypothetical protein